MKLRNKRLLSLFISLSLILGIVIGGSSQIAYAQDVKSITIVHVNDVHGEVKDNGSSIIGYSKLKAKVDELKATNPNLLLLNAGDTLHGTVDINLTSGESMVNIMNKVGFDAMVPGNHDFNYGYERLLELKSMATFEMLGSNILKEDKTSDFKEYIIKEFDGIKVGIFALATPETKVKTHPNNTKGIEFSDPVEASKAMVKKLQEEKVDLIVGLAHLGIDESSEDTAIKVAENVEGIDVIVDGHSHSKLEEGTVVNNTLIVQAEYRLANIGVVEVQFTDGKLSSKTASLISYEDAKAIVPDAAIETEIAAIAEVNEPMKAVVVGKSPSELVGVREVVRAGESNLGNIVTDAMKKAIGADITLTNGGGIRASIPAGDITVGNILTAFPFTNFLVMIEVTGSTVVEALEFGVDSYPEPAGKFPHVSGIKFDLNPNKEAGNRVSNVLINGEPIDLEKTYKLVTNDFMASGGDGYTMFAGSKVLAEGALLSDVLIDYIKEVEEVNTAAEGRINAKEIEVIEPITPEIEKPEPVEEIKPEPVQTKYVVNAGDVLWKIAKSFGTTWEKLAEYNNLNNPNLIYPKQVILIP